MKHLITATLSAIISAWITYSIVTAIISAILSAWITYSIVTGNCEADIDAAWLDGYQTYQEDTYLPKPDHKQPDYRLKKRSVDDGF